MDRLQYTLRIFTARAKQVDFVQRAAYRLRMSQFSEPRMLVLFDETDKGR